MGHVQFRTPDFQQLWYGPDLDLDWVGSVAVALGSAPGAALEAGTGGLPEVAAVAELPVQVPVPAVGTAAGDIAPVAAALGDIAPEDMLAAYTDRIDHNTIDHTAEYTSIDWNILDMCSFFHLGISSLSGYDLNLI
jgi:hypothetical protein